MNTDISAVYDRICIIFKINIPKITETQFILRITIKYKKKLKHKIGYKNKRS